MSFVVSAKRFVIGLCRFTFRLPALCFYALYHLTDRHARPVDELEGMKPELFEAVKRFEASEAARLQAVRDRATNK